MHNLGVLLAPPDFTMCKEVHLIWEMGEKFGAPHS